MSKRRVGLVGLSGVLVPGALAFTLAAPVIAGDPCYHGFDIPARTVGSDPQVKVAPCAFAPTVTRIPVGGTVTFFNGDGPTHLITGANQEWGSRDIELRPDASVSYTFAEAGTYPYACALHRGMSGAIVVGDPDVAVAVTDETGNSTGPMADASASDAPIEASATSSDLGLPALATTGAIGILAGAALTALVMRRPTSATPPRGPSDRA